MAENPYVEIAYPNYNPNIFVTATKYFPRDGDINEDGNLTNADLVGMARYIIVIDVVEGQNITHGDMDKNNLITNAYLVAVAQMLIA